MHGRSSELNIRHDPKCSQHTLVSAFVTGAFEADFRHTDDGLEYTFAGIYVCNIKNLHIGELRKHQNLHPSIVMF